MVLVVVLMDLTVAEVGVMVQLTMDGRDTSVPLVRRAVACSCLKWIVQIEAEDSYTIDILLDQPVHAICI